MSGKGSCDFALASRDERGDVNLFDAASNLCNFFGMSAISWRASCISRTTIGAAKTRLRMERMRDNWATIRYRCISGMSAVGNILNGRGTSDQKNGSLGTTSRRIKRAAIWRGYGLAKAKEWTHALSSTR